MSINLHLYPTSIVSESRFFRTVTSISENFKNLEIHICGIWKKGLAEEELTSNRLFINRFKINVRGFRGTKSLLYYHDFKKAVLKKYAEEKIEIVHCHSLFDLGIGVYLKKLHPGIKLIYDAHELETEKNRLKGIYKYYNKLKEKKYIKKTDEVIVVNESIARWYVAKYKISNITVIKNIVVVKNNIVEDRNYFRNKFNIPSRALVFIYVGSLQTGRGIELLLHVFKTSTHHLVIMGFGELESTVLKHCETNNNVHFHPAVSREYVIPYTSTADVGMALIENSCLSYFLCLPNKLYEYLFAGIPIISSNFPEMSNLINKYEAGWTTPVDIKSISAIVNNISFEDVKQKKLKISSSVFEKWETEEKKLIELYKKQLASFQ